ncbi:Probable WRKY transcription factor 20 [Linum perenne]
MKPQTAHGSFLANLHSVTAVSSDTFGERTSSFFEFRSPHRTNMTCADMNNRRSERSIQSYGTCQSQIESFSSLASLKAEMASSSNELHLKPLHVHMVSSGAENQKDNSSSRLHASQSDQKGGTTHSMTLDDGYNWRKYGQKHVKGSEFPPSYYKCTHPNCEVKKLFECSHEGQITEIIYKGTHEHPKPQLSRRSTAGALLSDKILHVVRDGKSSCGYGEASHTSGQNGTPELSLVAAIHEIAEGVGEDPLFSKRRRMDTGSFDVTSVIKPIREPRVVVQTVSEVDILDDGYKWRKYGQKVVRGNPNPRSYYKCTNGGCPVRKQVERASDDPNAVITTYQGKHNHDTVPTSRNNSK